MNQLTKVFENQNLTIIEKEGESYFKLNDVCEILGLAPRVVRQRLGEDVCATYPLQTAGGTQPATFVNEDGLYDVILDSRKPEAKKFRKWITSDVIPSIRKTGGYNALDTAQLSPELQMFDGLFKAVAKQEMDTKKLNNKVDGIRDVVALNTIDWRKDARNLINRIAQSRGGYQAYKEVHKEVYEEVERRGGYNLSTRLTNKRRRLADEGASKSKRDKLSKVDVIADDKRLVEIYVAVVKEFAIMNGIEVGDAS